MDGKKWIKKLSFHDNNGFTLIELLVAIFIVSIIMLTTHGLLEQVLKTGFHIYQYNVKTTKILQAGVILTDDLIEMQIDDRHSLTIMRDSSECIRELSFYTRNISDPDHYFIDTLHRVDWLISDTDLLRSEPVFHEANPVPLLTGMKCFQVKLLSKAQWLPIKGNISLTPAGVAFRLAMHDGIEIEKIIPLMLSNKTE